MTLLGMQLGRHQSNRGHCIFALMRSASSLGRRGWTLFWSIRDTIKTAVHSLRKGSRYNQSSKAFQIQPTVQPSPKFQQLNTYKSRDSSVYRVLKHNDGQIHLFRWRRNWETGVLCTGTSCEHAGGLQAWVHKELRLDLPDDLQRRSDCRVRRSTDLDIEPNFKRRNNDGINMLGPRAITLAAGISRPFSSLVSNSMGCLP